MGNNKGQYKGEGVVPPKIAFESLKQQGQIMFKDLAALLNKASGKKEDKQKKIINSSNGDEDVVNFEEQDEESLAKNQLLDLSDSKEPSILNLHRSSSRVIDITKTQNEMHNMMMRTSSSMEALPYKRGNSIVKTPLRTSMVLKNNSKGP